MGGMEEWDGGMVGMEGNGMEGMVVIGVDE